MDTFEITMSRKRAFKVFKYNVGFKTDVKYSPTMSV